MPTDRNVTMNIVGNPTIVSNNRRCWPISLGLFAEYSQFSKQTRSADVSSSAQGPSVYSILLCCAGRKGIMRQPSSMIFACSTSNVMSNNPLSIRFEDRNKKMRKWLQVDECFILRIDSYIAIQFFYLID